MTSTLNVATNLIENSYFCLELNERGQISRLFDKKHNREVLAKGARGNVFQLFEDKPLNFDAWDIDAFYKQKEWELNELVSCEVIEQGPLRAGLRLEWAYAGRTHIVQKLYMYASQPHIDFVTEVDWQERQTLLKVAFPVDVHNEFATADVQFGNIERPTYRNTSWDRAKFETCAHKWFDLSEGDYGVAILNDCKYGYDVHDNVMRQTLLKGAIYPDPEADLGHHEFTYSLLPHGGNWFEGKVNRVAYELNYPLLAVIKNDATNTSAKLPSAFSLIQVEPANIVIETVKKAEDSEALVVRLYECANRRGKFQIKLGFKATRAAETNLLEEEIAESSLADNGSTLEGYITPYQIKTFAFYPTK